MYSNFSQFGLYRYDDGSTNYRPKSSRNIHANIIICSILTMSLIFCALVYVFIDSRHVPPIPISKLPTFPINNPKDLFENGIEVIEISGKNASEESAPKRTRRLDSDESDRSPDSQKLIFFPSRTIKPPRISEKPRVINFPPVPPNHRMSSRSSEPRPFNHMMGGQKPNPFQMAHPNQFQRPQQGSTPRSFYQPMNNIQDIIRQNQLPGQQHYPAQNHFPPPNQFPTQNQFPAQNQFSTPHQFPAQHHKRPGRFAMINEMESNLHASQHPVQLAGKYRHPRKNGDLMKLFDEQQQTYATNQPDMVPDPFHNYKANSAFEINQMVMNGGRQQTAQNAPAKNNYFRRKFRQKVASIPNYQLRSKDAAGIYQNILHSGTKFQVDRNEEQKGKPLSMMLDIYPMAGEENEMNQMQQIQQIQQMVHAPRMPRLKPFQGYYQDPSYFNTMHFPQLMPRYPIYYRNPHQQFGESSNVRQVGIAKPSQLVVHLNLFPKNKVPFKRSSMEEEMETKKQQEKFEPPKNQSIQTSPMPLNINFNVNTGNGHPENIHHMTLPKDPYQNFNATTEAPYKPNYYYDETEEDQSLVVSPSLIYHNIQRDRPIQLMLRNSTAISNQNKKIKNHRHTYQTIERPRKQKIKSDPRNYGNIFQ